MTARQTFNRRPRNRYIKPAELTDDGLSEFRAAVRLRPSQNKTPPLRSTPTVVVIEHNLFNGEFIVGFPA
jgi:hypothetical protein